MKDLVKLFEQNTFPCPDCLGTEVEEHELSEKIEDTEFEEIDGFNKCPLCGRFFK